MPAIITHRLLGEEFLDRTDLFESLSPEAHNAFIWGLQGPDPLFFVFRTSHNKELHDLGRAMHASHVDELLLTMRDVAANMVKARSAERASANETVDPGEIAQAYAIGFLGHFLMDSTAHPYVFCMQEREQNRTGIDDGSYVHGIIESSLDLGLLRLMRDKALAEVRMGEFLPRDNGGLDSVAKLYREVALRVYDVDVPTRAYKQAFKDMRLLIKTLSSPNGKRRALMGKLERLARQHPYSMAEALTHVEEGERCYRFFNTENEPWANPFTGETNTASYGELFDQALERYLEAAALFTKGSPIADISKGSNFRGAK